MNKGMLAFVEECVATFVKKEANLKSNKQKLCDYFENKVVLNHSVIQARVKSPDSLREKIIRWGYYSSGKKPEKVVDELTDLIGIRIICLLTNDEATIFHMLKDLFIEVDEGYYTIINEPKCEYGYLRLDLTTTQPKTQKNGFPIYKIDGQWVEKDQLINVELQIKSMVNLLWGEIEHMLFYKNYSYVVDQFFYKKLISSIRENLKAVDLQLEILKDQLNPKDNAEVLIKEIEQYVSWIVYYQNREPLNRLLGCEIDFREIYSALIFLHFSENQADTYETAIETAKNIMERIKNINFNDNNEYSIVDINILSFEEKLRPLISQIHQMVRENIFWRMLISLHGIINELDTYEKAIANISKLISDLLQIYSNDTFEITTSPEAKICIEIGLNKGISMFLGAYGKIDFIIPSKQQEDICIIVDDIIYRIQQEITDNFYPEVGDLVSNLVAMDIYIKISKAYELNLGLDVINDFYNCYKEDNDCWKPPLDTVYIEELLSKENHFGFEEIDKLYQEEFAWLSNL